MKFNVSILLSVLTIFAYASLVAMEGRGLKRSEYEIQFSPDKPSLPHVVAAVRDVPRGGLIAMNGSFINNRELVTALAQAKDRGVRVEVCVDSRNSQNNILLASLGVGCVHSTIGMHTKRFIAFDVDPRDSIDAIKRSKGVVITGSENLSGMAGKHHEYTFLSKSVDLLKKHYEDHLYNKSLCEQHLDASRKTLEAEKAPDKVPGAESHFKRRKAGPEPKADVETSPKMTRIFNSQQFDSGKLKAARIAKPVQPDQNELILISSMGLDDAKVVEALHKKAVAGSHVYLVVDKSAIESERGAQLCKRLEDAGAHVYVWLKSTIHHAKLFLRERRNATDNEYVESLSILSTGNLCTNSSAEINYDKVIPDSLPLSQDIRTYFSSIIALCTRLADVDLKPFEEAREAKRQKRKAKRELAQNGNKPGWGNFLWEHCIIS